MGSLWTRFLCTSFKRQATTTHPPTHPCIVSSQAASSSAGCDPVAAQIGAVNTLIRQQQQPATGSSDASSSGSSSSKTSWRGYNTDWLAAISAIERVLAAGSSDAAAVTSSSGSNGSSGSSESVLKGKAVCVVGAGGAGRALAFGAASKGAKVIIANRCVCVCGCGVLHGGQNCLAGPVGSDGNKRVSAAVESGSKGTEICCQVCTPTRCLARECTASVLRDARVGLRSCCLDGR
jgi:hypothetical protein